MNTPVVDYLLDSMPGAKIDYKKELSEVEQLVEKIRELERKAACMDYLEAHGGRLIKRDGLWAYNTGLQMTGLSALEAIEKHMEASK